MRYSLGVLVLIATVGVLSLVQPSGRAEAFIHEIVAANCSGGGVGVITGDGELVPPPLDDFGSQTFAKPVLASGAVELTGAGPVITDAPQNKVQPGSALDPVVYDHPSSDHCPKAP